MYYPHEFHSVSNLGVDHIHLIKMSSQCSNHILMIRPVNFGFNPETASDNVFQKIDGTNPRAVQNKALEEFELLVKKLKSVGVTVHVVEDTADPHTPDSVFPNNWISTHEEDSTICLYPMAAKTRRLERKPHVLHYIEKTFEVKRVLDFTRYENHGKHLEGTGSMVLDRENHIAYACISERTDEELFEKFCKAAGYRPVIFHAADESGKPIYHTNVLMSVADKYAILCLESIKDPSEQEVLLKELKDSGKVVIRIAYRQLNCFAGNMLQVKGLGGHRYLVMSSQAYDSLDFEQITKIEGFDTIVHSDLRTIESNGGGSARCMMAEIFLPLRK